MGEAQSGDQGKSACYILSNIIQCFTFLNRCSDDKPPFKSIQKSPGRSQTTGGFSCALRNTFNIADTPDYEMDLDLSLAILGKVYIYDSTSDLMELDPNTMKP